MKIAHIITGLGGGGAEMMLSRLVLQHQMDGLQSRVFSLVSDGMLKPKIEASGIEVVDLDFPRGGFSLRGFTRLVKNLNYWKPDVVLCWMYHANLIGGLAAKLAGRTRVIWNIRNSTLDSKNSSRMTIAVMKAGAFLSFLPQKIISCSTVARDVHIKEGYRQNKFVIIPNGFDIHLFKPDIDTRIQFYNERKLPAGAVCIGFIGRYDPQKDFDTFFDAAAKIAKADDRVQFVLCGEHVDDQNEALLEAISQVGITSKVHLLGYQSEIQKIHQSLDVLVSSSAFGEAFPNVIAEAMACGTPCVATDVGDARSLIVDTGLVVPPRDPQALADAVLQLIALPRSAFQAKQQAARQRIVDHYSIEFIAEQYRVLFDQVINRH